MFRNYLKIAFRNLWKNKGYAVINIGGLAIALAGFILALLYVNHELAYDRGFRDYQQIYRVEQQNGGKADEQFPLLAGPLAGIFSEKYPEIKAAIRINKAGIMNQVLVKADKAHSLYVDNLYFADSNFFSIFNYPFLYGSPARALKAPNSVILSETLAYQLFGRQDPTGRTLRIGGSNDLTITGVYNEKAFPSHFSMDIIRPYVEAADPWHSNYAYTYVQVSRHANISSLSAELTATYKSIFTDRYRQERLPEKYIADLQQDRLVLRPVKDIHLGKQDMYELSPGGSQTVLWLIGLLVTFMLIVAAINFTNLTIALAPERAKEIGMRKVLGARRPSLIRQFATETFVQCLLALFLALVCAELLMPSFSHLLDVPLRLSVFSTINIWAQIGLLLFIIFLAAGVYPAAFLSGLQPVKIIKGNLFHTQQGTGIRKGLIVLQCIITTTFIAGLFIIRGQVSYMQQKDLGFRPQQVISININDWNTQARYPLIMQELLKIPGVLSVSPASTVTTPGEQTFYSIKYKGKRYNAQYLCVGTDYFNVMKARIVLGRNFSGRFPSDTLHGVIINQAMANKMGIKKEQDLAEAKEGNQHDIVGVVADMNFYGFEQQVQPMAFFAFPFTAEPYILVRLSTDHLSDHIGQITNLWKKIEPSYPLRYSFLDQEIQRNYISYERLGKVFSVFTLLSLLIAVLGLYALAALMTKNRTKEISIRKTMGASLNDILKLLNKDFVVLVLIAGLMAWPLAYILMQKWLNGFAYRIHMPVLPFVLATLIPLLLTIITVSVQALRVAKANLVEVLKYE